MKNEYTCICCGDKLNSDETPIYLEAEYEYQSPLGPLCEYCCEQLLNPDRRWL